MGKSDLTSLVEHMPAFEEKTGISLTGISVFLDRDDDFEYMTLSVRGELQAAKEDSVRDDFSIKIVVYDNNDRVIETANISFDLEGFLGFDIFSEWMDIPTAEIGKIRIFPKQGY